MIFQRIANFLRDIFGDRYKFVYWVIAVATAQHTAWGAATTMQGSGSENAPIWWFQGLAFAIAIDVSMVLVATKIRSGNRANAIRYALTFAGVALLSSYFQLLYAWAHIGMLPAGEGVSADWQTQLQAIVDARLLIAPFALPAISIAYTIAGFGKGGEKESNRSKRASNGNPSEIRVEVPALPAKSTLGHSKAPDATRRVREYYEDNPDALEENPKQVAKRLEVGKSTVYAIRKELLERTNSNGHYNGYDDDSIR